MPELVSRLELALADLAVDRADVGSEISYELRGDRAGAELLVNDERVQRFTRVGSAVDHLVGAINQGVLDTSPDTLNLHAAAVADATGNALLLPGVSGAGKTTLCAALVGAGLAYMSDEMIGVEPVDLTLLGYPKGLTVKAGGRDLLGHHVDLRPCSMGDGTEARWYVPAGALGDGGVRTTSSACAVVFARRLQGAEPSLDAISRPESVLRLLLNTFDLGRFGPGGVELLARLVSQCHCAMATYDEADAVVPLVSGLLHDAVDPVELVPLAAHGPSGRPATVSTDASSSAEHRDGVVGIAFPDGGVLYDPATGRALLLDRIGVAVWPILDGHTSIGELADELAGHFDAGAEEIRGDLLSLCHQLAESGFLAGIEATVDPPDWRKALAALDAPRR